MLHSTYGTCELQRRSGRCRSWVSFLRAGNYCFESWVGRVLNKPVRCFALGSSRLSHVSLQHTAIVEARNMLILRFKCVTVRNEESASRMALNDWCTVEFVVAVVPFGDRNWPYEIHYLVRHGFPPKISKSTYTLQGALFLHLQRNTLSVFGSNTLASITPGYNRSLISSHLISHLLTHQDVIPVLP